MKVSLRTAFFIPLFIAVALYSAGCKSSPNANNANTAQDQPTADAGAPDDPANVNVVPVSNSTSAVPAAAPQAAPASSSSAASQALTSGSVAYQYPDTEYNADNGYGQPAETYAEQPPPALPTYQQPQCPGDGYIWTPGYWNYASAGYYWAPGAWVMAPYQGALWTPGYWGYRGGRYAFYQGYWGRHVGYYGGINYGAGYVGSGYQGGYWNGNVFSYNRTVNNINTTVVRNVYAYNVRNVTVTNVSYNGGAGGVQYRPHPSELVAIHEVHNPPMAAQVQVVREAQANRNNFVAVNRGRPEMVVVSHPVPAERVAPPPVVHYAQVRPQERAMAPAQRPAEAQRPEAQRPEAQRPEAQRPGQAARPEAPQQRAEQQRQEQQQKTEQAHQQQQQKAEQAHQEQQQRAVQQKQAQQQKTEQMHQQQQQKTEQAHQEQQQRAVQQKQAQQQKTEQQHQQQQRPKQEVEKRKPEPEKHPQ